MKRRKVIGKAISYEKDFFVQYKYLSKDAQQHGFLESGRGGRYHIAILTHHTTIVGKDNKLTIQSENDVKEQYGNIIDLFQNYMNEHKIIHNKKYPAFQGGAFGYFSYDCMHYMERIPQISNDDLQTPDLYFLLVDEVFVYDKETNKLWMLLIQDEGVCRAAEFKKWEEKWNEEVGNVSLPFQEVEGEKSVSFTEEDFVEAVKRVQTYIAAGDVFQVNLSVRQGQPLKTHPLKIYEALREINPSPYMGYLALKGHSIISGSPELLVKKEGKKVSTRPIAGTRSRGNTDEEDRRLAEELIHNEKERAEHVMLVDLERNDLGRVCQYGTVEVNEFMVIEKYSHVMHIVSNVQGDIAEGKDAFDLVKATFPGGTITGAPKIRTMEIIEELEPVRRGLYTGSIGWISYSGEMELNIVIRTMFVKDGIGYVQAGAGVVIDSDPVQEYKESLKKAVALWKAKEKSEQEEVE